MSLDWNGYVVTFAALVISCRETWARCGKSIGIMLQGPKWNMFETTRILARNFCFWSLRPMLTSSKDQHVTWKSSPLLQKGTSSFSKPMFYGFSIMFSFRFSPFIIFSCVKPIATFVADPRCSISAWLTVSRKASRQPQQSGGKSHENKPETHGVFIHGHRSFRCSYFWV